MERRDFFKGAAAGRRRPGRQQGSRRPEATPVQSRPRVKRPTEADEFGYAQARGTANAGRGRQRRRRAVRIRFHGGRAQEARLRVRRDQPGLGVPGTARVAAQLRRATRARTPHVPARRSRRGHGARLRQGRRQADARHGARDGRHCCTRRWRCSRPGPIACPSSSSSASTAIRRASSTRPHSAQDMGAHRPRLREVRRRGDDARAVRRSRRCTRTASR